MNLAKKESMDKDAEKSVKSVLNRVDEILNLFMSSRNSGTTTALIEAVKEADSPLILSGDMDHGKRIAKRAGKNKMSSVVLSWNGITPEKTRGTRGQIIPDNSFMIRAFDSIKSTIRFLLGEVKRLQDQNETLRDANDRLADKTQEALSDLREVKQVNEKLRNQINKLKSNNSTNGEA